MLISPGIVLLLLARTEAAGVVHLAGLWALLLVVASSLVFSLRTDKINLLSTLV